VEAKLDNYIERKVISNRGNPETYNKMSREEDRWKHKKVILIYGTMMLGLLCIRNGRILNPERRQLVKPPKMNDT
jgi:hypothetical protein